jgi:uncharacterized protein DUF2516
VHTSYALAINAFGPLNWLNWILIVAAFVIEAWAFADALRRPTAAFPAASKQTKPIWLLITGVALAIGIFCVADDVPIINIVPLIAFLPAAFYLVDVRPKVREIGKGGSSRQGPYGPW